MAQRRAIFSVRFHMKTRQFLLLFSLGALLFSGALSSCAQAQTPPTSTRFTPKSVVDAWTKRRAIYDYDRRAPLEKKLVRRTQNSVSVIEKFTIRGVRGATEPFYIVMPLAASPKNRAPSLILIHGLTQNIDEMLIVAQLYAAQGYASLIPEYVNHGDRFSDRHARFGSDASGLRSDIIESVGDIRRTLDVFCARDEIDPKRIALVGFSLGAILGTMTTALDSRVSTAIFAVGGGDWRTILGDSSISSPKTKAAARALSAAQIALLDDVDPKNFVAQIAPRPVLMMNGRRDDIIPVAAAQIFFQSARSPKRQIWFDSGHILPVFQVAEPINSWLQQQLRASTKSTFAKSATRRN